LTFYPVSLDVSGRPCLVVGGGPVAARKARALLGCDATVTVIAPTLSDDLEALVPSLHALERRCYEHGDATAFRLVVTATGRPEVDGAVYADAEGAGVWVNSADDRAHSSFILPAVHRDGAVTVAVSTGGLSPALASWLRTRLAALCGENLGTLAQMLAEARRQLQEAGRRSDSVDWTGMLDGPLPELVQSGDLDNAQAIVRAAVGH
jgi:siroheme synthase-like protein